MTTEIVGWRATKPTGEELYCADIESKPKCPACDKAIEPPTECCGWHIKNVYSQDLDSIVYPWVRQTLEGGESASKKKAPKKNVTKKNRRSRSPSRSSKPHARSRSSSRRSTRTT